MNSEIRESLALANASGYYFLQIEELTRPATYLAAIAETPRQNPVAEAPKRQKTPSGR